MLSAPTLWLDPPPPPRPASLWSLRGRAGSAGFALFFGLIFGGIGGLVGAIATIAGVASGELTLLAVGLGIGVVFAGIGGVVGWRGLAALRRIADVVRDGEVVAGRVERMGVDRSVRVNGAYPIRVDYSFLWRGETIDGSATTWKVSLLRAPPGAPVAVLVDPRDPQRNVAWLPLR